MNYYVKYIVNFNVLQQSEYVIDNLILDTL